MRIPNFLRRNLLESLEEVETVTTEEDENAVRLRKSAKYRRSRKNQAILETGVAAEAVPTDELRDKWNHAEEKRPESERIKSSSGLSTFKKNIIVELIW